jgi:HTH-type transcriptional regulator/antitoxin HigA
MGAPELLALGEEYRQLRARLPLGVIKDAAEYDAAVALLDEIIDLIGEEEAHPLADLAEAIATFVEAYDHRHYAAA